jgi:hypothetical protein
MNPNPLLYTMLAGIAILAVSEAGVKTVEILNPPAPPALAAAIPAPAPVIEELNAEIAAREAELDELANALASAIADRNEAVAMLQSAGLVIPVEMPDGPGLTQSHEGTKGE